MRLFFPGKLISNCSKNTVDPAGKKKVLGSIYDVNDIDILIRKNQALFSCCGRNNGKNQENKRMSNQFKTIVMHSSH